MLWTVDGADIVTTRDLHEETFSGLGFINSQAEGINDAGQVIGRAYDGFRERAFLWDNGVVTFLDGAVEAGFHSFAYTINNADDVQIVGGAHDQTGGSRRVLLWTVLADGTVLTEELPTLAGFEFSWPTDLNDIGEVVGTSHPSNNLQDGHATLWTFAPNTADRTIVDLGIGAATAIDNSARLVGLTRVVGLTKTTVGKGRRKTRNNHAILWEVEPIIP
jgi:probable HAF family extracellular repeat protein